MVVEVSVVRDDAPGTRQALVHRALEEEVPLIVEVTSLLNVRETLGNDWLHPDLFRFGASSLANDLLMQLVKQATGVYQSADYFSTD